MEIVSSIDIPKRWRRSKINSSDHLDRLVFSLFDDAVSTNGWERRRGRLFPPKATTTDDRIAVAKNILTERMLEQFHDEERKSKFRDEFKFHQSKIVDPNDIPLKADEIAEMFSNVNIQPVVNEGEKRQYRFLRHSWRLPFNTTPGRTLSFIVTAGPDSKVIGIFSLASPAMWMASRDEALGYEKLDLSITMEGKVKTVEQKVNWCQRLRMCGMVDNGKSPHHLSGKFSVDEYITALMEGLIARIHQFPVILFEDRPELIERAEIHGVLLDKTAPSKWLKAKEPIKTQTDRKAKKKRRRITKQCLDALDRIKQTTETSPPTTVEDLFDCLHETKDQSLLKAMKYGVREAKTRRISGDIAEMVICGAVPPLNPFRVGKLIALLAVSSTTREIWNETYSDVESVIASQLAMRPIRKKANLSSVSTTGLWGASNAQYSRLSLPTQHGQAIRWRQVGITGTNGSGPSNLMLSKRSWKAIDAYLAGETVGVSGKFGEGTSARIRRMQKAFKLADEESSQLGYTYAGELRAILSRIVENSFSRSVHVANLHHNSIRYNLGIDDTLDFESGADLHVAVDHWKERWLLPYLHRNEKTLNKTVKRIRKTNLSSAYPPFDEGA